MIRAGAYCNEYQTAQTSTGAHQKVHRLETPAHSGPEFQQRSVTSLFAILAPLPGILGDTHRPRQLPLSVIPQPFEPLLLQQLF